MYNELSSNQTTICPLTEIKKKPSTNYMYTRSFRNTLLQWNSQQSNFALKN